MYRWYKDAAVCLTYLSDVLFTEPLDLDALGHSRWFTRGWTLQELIAPAEVVFYSSEWRELTGKSELASPISNITGIPESILLKTAALAEFSVAARMSWASNRQTTRIEDEAYCLIGLFGIQMPLIYGEKEMAFIRLQEEIMKINDDQSIFAWTLRSSPKSKEEGWEVTGLLAKRPNAFATSGDIVTMGIWGKGAVRGMTSRGTRVKLFLNPVKEDDAVDFMASLDCWSSSAREATVVIFLRRLGTNTTDWQSPHEATFGRIHPFDVLGQGTALNKANGMYRDICVTQMSRSLEAWNLRAYDHLGAHILIHLPGRHYSVYPADSWEPQTGVFTLQPNKTGTIGAVGITGDFCNYIVYFGGYNTAEGLWVKAEIAPISGDFLRGDVREYYQFTGEEASASEVLSQRGTGFGTEKISASAKLAIVYEVLIYEIRIIISHAPQMYKQVQDFK